MGKLPGNLLVKKVLQPLSYALVAVVARVVLRAATRYIESGLRRHREAHGA